MTTDARKDHLVGTQVGEYLVEERIGVGGMGVVYRASQKSIGKQVAIKVLRAEVMEDPREMERFRDEARAVNAISHRGIVSIFGSGELVDGRQYLVMEYLKGEGLDARLQREGRIPAADAIPILDEVASALGGVHAAGIVHRDLKPGNVFLVEQSDGKPWIKLLDFGLARRGERTDVSRIAGTPDYLSPEHSRGMPAGPPSDLYSLGVMMFQLLTGQLPFTGRSALEVMEKHVYSEPPNALTIEPSIPEALNTLMAQLLRKDPATRPTMVAIKGMLKQATKQVRAASTQPGVADMAVDVLAARAAAAAKEQDAAQSAPTPQPGGPAVDGATAPTPAALPLLEGLPAALKGRSPSDSSPSAAPVSDSPRSAAPRPRPADPQQERRQRRMLFGGLGALGLLVAGVVGLAFMKPQVQAIDDSHDSRSRAIVAPTDITRTPMGNQKLKDMAPVIRMANPDEDSMPANPAEADWDAGR